ncbi:glycosyltransferase [Hippea alviniae]|uniref:glycosyltransferase n=1 Tax=Hippea alviniae TaxID=1279027 RepID=UPI0003B6BE6D|nr:glycosyltransferase [Hippea alviniae]
MRIAFILDEIWDSALTNYALQIAELTENSNEVYIICLKDSYVDKKNQKNSIHIKPLRSKNPLRSFAGFISLSRQLKNIKPDTVITIRGDATFFSCLLKKSLNFKLIRIFGIEKEFRSPPECVDKVILPCNYLKGFVSKKRVKNIEVLKSFIDREKFKFSQNGRKRIRKELNLNNSLVFGAVGRLDRVKGFDLLIESFAKANIENSKLVIVGEEKGVKKENLIKLAKELNINNDVILITERRKDIIDLMSAFDIGVISSVSSEVIPRVLFEFMSIGLPITTTDVGCLKEIANDSFAVLSEPTVHSLKSALKQISKADLVKMSAASLKEVEKYSLHLPDDIFIT